MGHVIECPSGLIIEGRKILISDQKVLADRALAKSGGAVDALLRACTVSVIDPGIYEFPGGQVSWPDVLQGDRMYALTRLRAITHGERYEFKCQCPARHRFAYGLNLCDLPVKKLPEASKAILRAGGVFETRMPDETLPVPADGRTVRFKLMNGRDETRLQGLLRGEKEDDRLEVTLAYRIVEIEGIEARDKRRWLNAQGLGFLVDLQAAFDAVDCGVETEIEVDCNVCPEVFDTDVPFGKEFLMPKKRSSPTT